MSKDFNKILITGLPKLLFDLMGDYLSDPENHTSECDVHRYKVGATDYYQENAIDHCTCNNDEVIEQFIYYFESKGLEALFKNKVGEC